MARHHHHHHHHPQRHHLDAVDCHHHLPSLLSPPQSPSFFLLPTEHPRYSMVFLRAPQRPLSCPVLPCCCYLKRNHPGLGVHAAFLRISPPSAPPYHPTTVPTYHPHGLTVGVVLYVLLFGERAGGRHKTQNKRNEIELQGALVPCSGLQSSRQPPQPSSP